MLRLTWLLLSFILGTLCVAVGHWSLFALFLTVVLLPVLSLPGRWLAGKHLNMTVEVPVNLHKKQTGEVVVQLKNNTWLPLSRVRCKLQMENLLTGQLEHIWVTTGCLPRKTIRIPLEFCGIYSGRVSVRLEKTLLYDCFGVWGIKCRMEASSAVTVQPDTFVQKLLISSTHGCPDDSETYSPYRPGNDLTETFQIREYQEGDNPRQIHWKLTGKLDKLIVRDPSLPITRSVVVFWERTAKSAETAQLADLQAEVVLSACKALVEQVVHFTMIWNDTETDLCVMQEIRDMDDLIGLMPRLLSAKSRVGGVTGAEAFIHAAGEGVYSHILYVAAEPTELAEHLEQLGHLTQVCFGGVLQSQQTVTLVDREHYAEQLIELEI